MTVKCSVCGKDFETDSTVCDICDECLAKLDTCENCKIEIKGESNK